MEKKHGLWSTWAGSIKLAGGLTLAELLSYPKANNGCFNGEGEQEII